MGGWRDRSRAEGRPACSVRQKGAAAAETRRRSDCLRLYLFLVHPPHPAPFQRGGSLCVRCFTSRPQQSIRISRVAVQRPLAATPQASLPRAARCNRSVGLGARLGFLWPPIARVQHQPDRQHPAACLRVPAPLSPCCSTPLPAARLERHSIPTATSGPVCPAKPAGTPGQAQDWLATSGGAIWPVAARASPFPLTRPFPFPHHVQFYLSRQYVHSCLFFLLSSYHPTVVRSSPRHRHHERQL